MEPVYVITKTKWTLDDAHTEISFKVKHFTVSSIRGFFKEYHASIHTIGEDFSTAEIDVWINAASIKTGDETRDGHLKSKDFLDVENFREINFTGSSTEKIGNDRYALYGDLTIKRITKRIRLDIEFGGIVNDAWHVKRAGFLVTGKINRKDFGLTWHKLLETGGAVVGEEVFINCEIELTKQS